MRSTKIDLQCKIADLASKYRAEMVRQNNLSSVVRSYANSDIIRAQIRELESELIELN